MPPLSFVDKVIYWTILLILCVLYFGLALVLMFLRERIAFADDMVIAKADNISYLWFLVPWMTFFLMTFILWLIPYEGRRPIFGLRNFKYGPPAWPKIYPVFMKNKPYVWVSERSKENRKKIAVLLLVILLVSLVPFPWALYGRDCLRADGRIEQYSMFNNKVQDFSPGQISDVEFETYRYRIGRYSTRVYWSVRISLTTDSGRTYTFAARDFRGGGTEGAPFWLAAMLELKTRYDPSVVTYSGKEDLQKVVTDQGLTRAEEDMLYQLFGGW